MGFVSSCPSWLRSAGSLADRRLAPSLFRKTAAAQSPRREVDIALASVMNLVIDDVQHQVVRLCRCTAQKPLTSPESVRRNLRPELVSICSVLSSHKRRTSCFDFASRVANCVH